MVGVTPESAMFLRFVVGGFPLPVDADLCVDPVALAFVYLADPPGRSLHQRLADLPLPTG